MKATIKECGLVEKSIKAIYKYNKKSFKAHHDHEGFVELFILLEGSVCHCINEEVINLYGPTLLLLREKDQHHFQRLNHSGCAMVLIMFRIELFDQICQYLYAEDDISQLMDKRKAVMCPLPPEIERNIIDRRRVMEWIWNEDEKNLKVFLCQLMAILFEKGDKYLDNGYGNRVVPNWFDEIIVVENHKTIIREGLTGLKAISGKSNASLSKSFRKYLGITPSVYVNHLRINYAKDLLLSTDLPIGEVSAQSGYENLSHFYHRFKEYVGTSPKAYRTGSFEDYF